MTPIKRQNINRLAEQIRTVFEPDLLKNLEVCVERLGGTLEEYEDDPQTDAEIQKTGPQSFVIRINGSQPANRRRFSIAHELGHLFLHMGYLINPKVWDETKLYRDSVKYRFGFSEEEFEANEFAAAFLMPADEFKAVARKNRSEERYSIKPIAAHFSVSEHAAKVRGQWLGLFQWD